MIKNEINLKLSLPISVNKAYNNSKNWRIKSQFYKDYIKQLEFEFLQMEEKFKIIWDKWLEVKYDFYFKIYNKNWSIKTRDVFNFEKILSDSLSLFIEGFEDKKIKKWIIEKFNSNEEYVLITIKEVI